MFEAVAGEKGQQEQPAREQPYCESVLQASARWWAVHHLTAKMLDTSL
jgi:hypothetical protein